MSPLTQGRGLKHINLNITRNGSFVAPHAGAWIETVITKNHTHPILSPLTQGRGLKRVMVKANALVDRVAPHAGAWIETLTSDRTGVIGTGRPSRRGVD